LENLKHHSEILNELIKANTSYKVKIGILDLGCSGGPDQIFLEFNKSGIFLDYYGFDFNDEEIKRLVSEYPSNFKFYSKKIITERRIKTEQEWWNNFSAGQASTEAVIQEYTKSEIVDNNFWNSEFVNKSKVEIRISEILENIVDSLNLLKIDLDGPDFAYLQDFFTHVRELPQFVSLEINFQGSSDSESNTFHNTDRYMKSLGYNLVAITNRTYSNKNLPSRFQYSIFAQTIRGIPYQGDALYYKTNNYRNADELIRDVVLLDAFKLEDLAANIILENKYLIENRDQILLLNALTREVWGNNFMSYSDLMSKWEKDKKHFFPELPKESYQTLTDFTQIRFKEIAKILMSKISKKILHYCFRR
jgi:hypothetical protein